MVLGAHHTHLLRLTKADRSSRIDSWTADDRACTWSTHTSNWRGLQG